MCMANWINTLVSVGGLLGALATAVATFFLWRVTQVLAVETKRMAEATAQPHVVAILLPNQWSIRHFDLQIENTGNAAAYDVDVRFDPPLQNGEARRESAEIPFGKLSVLKPGQVMSSYLAEFNSVKDKVFSVEISWRRSTADAQKERNQYTYSMGDHAGVSRLGDAPLVAVAKSLKKIQENWEPIAKGNRRIRTDVFSARDRRLERQQLDKQRRQWRRQTAIEVRSTPNPPASESD